MIERERGSGRCVAKRVEEKVWLRERERGSGRCVAKRVEEKV